MLLARHSPATIGKRCDQNGLAVSSVPKSSTRCAIGANDLR
jgi:hypothetical protein